MLSPNDVENRFAVLKSMHTLVTFMNNENAYYNHWVYIIPDECDDNELREIAADEDEEIFEDACNLFNRLVRDYACKSGYCLPSHEVKGCRFKEYGCIDEDDSDDDE